MKTKYCGEDREQEQAIAVYAFRRTDTGGIEVQQCNRLSITSEEIRQHVMCSGHTPIGFVRVYVHVPSTGGRSILGDNDDILLYRPSFFDDDWTSEGHKETMNFVVNYIKGASKGSGLLGAFPHKDSRKNLKEYFGEEFFAEGDTEKYFVTRLDHDSEIATLKEVLKQHMSGCSACSNSTGFNLCRDGKQLLQDLAQRGLELDPQ